ncbi:gamma-glutamyl:cysteine ligase YbdK (ATP-grasp superfamily) [Motilibacter peucedani]|uniref:Gamma-glutamyl:cysteine ligase YbdK (ATP-grasp superfamily) n=1 Tax=Motilibacter peucedani TaxID=598650 RepID=A0A420XT30_9ACTN|nr:glutamate--cysteine ligase [Motilibacter peucedani]RKS77899.1 gamma-glutamyl:cysteine ligase YbdK (ATP-grasp superfamily) [Motilibacter peucedani]
MGKPVEQREFTRDDRRRYREKVHRDLDALARMLAEDRFADESPMTGLEVELNLVDAQGDPAMRNAQVLESIADPAFQTELGRFTIEVNVPPQVLGGRSAEQLEGALRTTLDSADSRAEAVQARILMVGVLPTLREQDVSSASISDDSRYALLDEQILTARGEDISLAISGREQVSTLADSIAPEAACTSTQLHQQLRPEHFAAAWNASQAVSGVQLAVGANSPYLFGRQLWQETRIALFQQATDTRSEELKAQGVRPRVWFGERWVTSIFDLFEENVRYFPALLPVCSDEDPLAVLEAGGAPELSELALLNGTIYRWNRPIYDVTDGSPHLRVENRVLPAGPTVLDTLANALFYYGVTRVLAEEERPVWSRLPFGVAEDNFLRGARDGIEASVTWPGMGRLRATDLVLRHLLPLAHEGLARYGVDPDLRDRYLGVVEGRCAARRNAASWQVAQTTLLESRHGMDRASALRAMTGTYRELMHTNDPVHTWPVG